MVSLSWENKHTLPSPIEYSLKPESNTLYIGDSLQVMRQIPTGLYNLIYVDPPYNTKKSKNKGYRDSYSDDEYCQFLYLIFNECFRLLDEKGIIVVSIDDNSVHIVRCLLDEVFGRKHFVIDCIRKTKTTTNDNKRGINIQHENTIIYAKNDNILRGETKGFENYQNPDNDPNGDWVSGDPSARTGSHFPIQNPFTAKIDYPSKNSPWRFSEKTFQHYVNSGKIKFKESHKDNERGFIFKRYKNEVKSNLSPVNSLFGVDNAYMNQSATIDLNKLFPEFRAFEFSKPVKFLQKIVQYTNYQGGKVLDVFCGSGALAVAVERQNKLDAINRIVTMINEDKPFLEYTQQRLKFENITFSVVNF